MGGGGGGILLVTWDLMAFGLPMGIDSVSDNYVRVLTSVHTCTCGWVGRRGRACARFCLFVAGNLS